MFGEDVHDDVADAMQQAIDAVADRLPGAVDDLLLLELLLAAPDDNLLRALGSRSRTILREVAAARANDVDPRPLPAAEDLVRFAASEAFDLGGYSTPVGAVHVVLALFAFQGAASEAVLQRCGVEWRPLRSIVRRLGLGW